VVSCALLCLLCLLCLRDAVAVDCNPVAECVSIADSVLILLPSSMLLQIKLCGLQGREEMLLRLMIKVRAVYLLVAID